MRTFHSAHAVAVLAVLIAACAPQLRERAPQPKPAASQAPENFPRSDYEQATVQGKPVYRIDPARALVSITLRGVTRSFEIPAQMETGTDEMSVAGLLEFNQSDFGIVPFSILGGAIRVQDRMSLRFQILARRNGLAVDGMPEGMGMLPRGGM